MAVGRESSTIGKTGRREARLPAGSSGLRRGSNLEHVADFNDSVVLDAIRRSRTGSSRAELTAETGLAAQTVSDVCQRLLDQGLIAETGTTSTGFGRPRRTLELVPASRYALGIHIDPATITYVLLDLSGNLVAHFSRQTSSPQDADVILAGMTSALDVLLAGSGIEQDRILGLGIAAPGPIDIAGGVMVDPPHLPGWHRVELVDRLHQATGLPVVLGKDVTAAVVAERWAGAAIGSSDFAFLYLGTGVGVGLVNGDIVVRGRSGNAGDIGHLIVDVDGPPCICGQRGCLGAACSPLFLIQEAVAAGVLPASPDDGQLVQAVRRVGTLCRAADDGDERAVAVLHQSARRLARAITTIGGILDTELVVCGGPAWAPAAHHYLPLLKPMVAQQFVMREIHGLNVVGTALGADVAAIGAACLILDERFAARP
ncbi:ROK family transcriptional regulator [Streptosporangium amethystogenes]|uniref:ROK family transcriptional regulator n=1 Tax=Streptosporangium amethystogenes TaxID=2002 RepID=UPI000A4D2E86|nr:ROK family transcriptional regulator [Streptosporangium amethystogenes]